MHSISQTEFAAPLLEERQRLFHLVGVEHYPLPTEAYQRRFKGNKAFELGTVDPLPGQRKFPIEVDQRVEAEAALCIRLRRSTLCVCSRS